MTLTETNRSEASVGFSAMPNAVAGGGGKNLPFNARALGRCLAVVIAVVVVVGTLANYAVYNVVPHPEHPVADVLKRFDLGHEPSIPAFYSSSVMLAAAAFLVFLGRFDGSGEGTRRRYWYALAILFLCLAIDEAVMFHEMGTAFMDRLDFSGPFYFSWIVPGFCFAAVVGLLFVRFLLSLNRRTRTRLVLSGVVFIAGAIGMEFVAGIVFDAAASEEDAMRSLLHVAVQAIEEGLEMIGVAMFLCALVDYARITGLCIDVGSDIPQQTMNEI